MQRLGQIFAHKELMASHVSILEQTEKEILNFHHTQEPYEMRQKAELCC